MSVDVREVLKDLQVSWRRPTGLGLLVFLFAGGAKLLVPESAPWQIALGVPLLTGLVVLCAWLWLRRPRKTRRGKVGICIALACESDEDRKKVKADFIDNLRDLASRGGAAGTLDVFELPEHLCTRIGDAEIAEAARLRVRAHMMIFGRIRRREIDGRPEFFISLEGIVAHRSVPKEVQRRFSEEFAEVLPRKVRLSLENDVLSFDVLSTWTDIAARYVIGIAALISGDADYAEAIFRDLDKSLAQLGPEAPPALEKIRSRLPNRLRVAAEVRADRQYRRWVKTRDPGFLVHGSEILDSSPPPDPNSSGFYNLRAIEHIVLRSDPAAALLEIDSFKGPTDPGILVNRAFALALLGRLPEATRQYRHLSAIPPSPALSDVQEQVTTFLDWYLNEHPRVASIQFLSGYFHRKVTGSARSAIRRLTEFVRNPDSVNFPNELELAKKWIGQLEKNESADR